MARREQNKEGQLLTGDEERRLGESLRKALIADRPNPSREGCPDPKTLRDLAFHKRIGDPAAFERVTLHLAECSACVRDALGYAEEYKEYRKRRRAAALVVGLAAVLVVSIASWFFWRLEPVLRSPEVARDVMPSRPGGPEIAEFETVTIELPGRLRGRAASAPEIVLPRGRLRLEVRLPTGSPEGKYKFRILGESGDVRKEAEAAASTLGGVAKVTVALDTSGLPPGTYTLSVMEPDLPEWLPYPLALK